MNKDRLQAFSDGVLAVIITIMVLEMKSPIGTNLAALEPVIPVFLSYVLSFVYIGIYWNNHHHLLHATQRVNGATLWANLHLLFWLSLVPFTTSWMGENHFARWTVVLYGTVLILCGLAYVILSKLLVKEAGADSPLAVALRNDWKGSLSVAVYALAVGLAFLDPRIALGLFILVALIWFIPDPRIEKRVKEME